MFELVDVEEKDITPFLKTWLRSEILRRDGRESITVIYNSKIASSLLDLLFNREIYDPLNYNRHKTLKKVGFKKVYFNKERVLTTYIVHFKDLKLK